MEFAVLTDEGACVMYQPVDGKAAALDLAADPYAKAPLFELASTCLLPAAAAGRPILGIAANASDDQIAAVTDLGQIMTLEFVSGKARRVARALL